MPKYLDANEVGISVGSKGGSCGWRPNRKNWLWGLMRSKNGDGCRGHHQGIKKQVKGAFVQYEKNQDSPDP